MGNDTKNTIQSWLELQRRFIPGVLRAVVLFGNPDTGPFQPAAAWPDASASTAGLSNAAASALQKKSVVGRTRESAPEALQQQGDIVAVPILRAEQLVGAVAMEIKSCTSEQRRMVVRHIMTNLAWLELMIDGSSAAGDSQPLAILDLVAASVEHTHYEAAANSAVTRFATHLGCDRVSLGFVREGRTEVRTMSGTSALNPKMKLTRAVGATMDEAIGQDATIAFPAEDSKSHYATRYHEELVKADGGAVCTIPIVHDAELVGAVTLEQGHPFDARTLALCETVVSLVGPVLYEKYLQDRWFGAKIYQALADQIGKFAAPGHLLLKTGVGAAICVAAFLAVAEGNFRVTADAMLEGTVQRIVVSPVDGYIKEALVRAGDIVEEGQMLARLDDKDLELELLEWTSEKTKLQREYRQAMAELDSTRVSILKAQLEQANARLALTAENLARTRVTSPMQGIIIAGDLSQSLGTPVERGDTLFEVAPLDSYRVMLKVDERDVRRLSLGQQGRLALVGFPAEPLPFLVERITPIATADDGRNFFTVEAALEHQPDRLRPGMEGVGKIDIGQRRLLWIWSHNLVDWLRLWAWAWTP
jgi:RND family efflux transporter MFP subunit